MYFVLMSNAILQTYAQSEDYYCGTDFKQAMQKCELPCPTGFDFECISALGDNYACFYFTGCSAKVAVPVPVPATDSPTIKPTPSPTVAAVATPAPVDPVITTAPTDAVITAAPTPQLTEAPSPAPTATTIETKSPTSPATTSPQAATEIPATSSAPTALNQDPSDNSQDAFCGESYFKSTEECSFPCPTGEDDECIDALGANYSCFMFTGCTAKLGISIPSEEENEPTAAPTPIPTSQADVYIVLTLRNTADRNMTADEEDELIRELTKLFSYYRYFQGKYEWSADKIEVWYQEQIDWQEDMERRKMQESVGSDVMTSTEVTLIISTWYQGGFSESEIAEAIAELIDTKEEDLIVELQGQDEFPFFYSLDRIQSRTVDKVTLSPVAAPKPAEAMETEMAPQPTGPSSGAGKMFSYECSMLT